MKRPMRGIAVFFTTLTLGARRLPSGLGQQPVSKLQKCPKVID